MTLIRRVIGWLRGPGPEVYLLVDKYPDDGDGLEAVISAHARHQGAELARANQARLYGPITYPAMGGDERSIKRLYDRLAVVNLDVQDQDDDA
ncbi:MULTISPECIES: hypothetical protein [unclassified Mycobacterium]|uniref:hypothetical protein n=1 Tax=unclassified Mycobacterium TaxID=2642494 RepID=UPI0029C64E56|nr:MULTISPECIES: hypothetical protein [unclassified Mycobacterium]